MTKGITFSALDRFLTGLGFVKTVISNSQMLYEHADSGTLLPLRQRRPSDRVDPGTLLVVRKFVVDNGLAEPEAFERLLQRTPA